jgi:hypothetical protein
MLTPNAPENLMTLPDFLCQLTYRNPGLLQYSFYSSPQIMEEGLDPWTCWMAIQTNTLQYRKWKMQSQIEADTSLGRWGIKLGIIKGTSIIFQGWISVESWVVLSFVPSFYTSWLNQIHVPWRRWSLWHSAQNLKQTLAFRALMKPGKSAREDWKWLDRPGA